MKLILLISSVFLAFNEARVQNSYHGLPIEVKAGFHVSDEPDDKMQRLQKEEKVKPRPYLNVADGQINFYYTTTQSTSPVWSPILKKEEPEASLQEQIYYKPTFRPPLLQVEISNVVVTTTTVSPTTTIASLSQEVDEKPDQKLVFDLTETLNQLSSNSLLNISVVFGLPVVTALLSFMGAGPIAIASAAWIIPLLTLLIVPDLLRLEE